MTQNLGSKKKAATVEGAAFAYIRRGYRLQAQSVPGGLEPIPACPELSTQ